ncbi:MAG: AAA family ATPase [Clostridia bacterium]|nr:AAA family ATPase [Clostridia bacterium]
MGQIITVASGKGGAGKTTVANGLARVLADMGYKVLLVDTDFGLGSAEFLLSGGDRVVYHLSDVASGQISLEKAVVSVNGEPDFLAAPPKEQSQVTWQQVAATVSDAAGQYDYVFLDRPAGLDFSLESYLSSFYALVVTQPDNMGIRGASGACSLLQQAGSEKCYVVLNRFRPKIVKVKAAPDIDTICERVGAQLLGIVPDDADLFSHQATGTFSLKAPYGKALFRIASRLKGQPIPLPKLTKIMK